MDWCHACPLCHYWRYLRLFRLGKVRIGFPGRPCDLARRLTQCPSYLVLDIVTKSFFGQEMGFLEHGDVNSLLSSTRANGPAIHALARLPRLKMFLLRSLGRFLVPTAGDGSGLGNVLKVRS